MTHQGPVRAAIVGFGNAGHGIHLPLMRAAGLDPVAAVATSARAETRAHGAGIGVVSTVDDLAGFTPDIIAIAVPDVAHEEFAMQALALSPKAIVIDKPLAPSSRTARRIIDAATERGVVVVPFQNRRWDGDFLTLTQLVSDGSIGEVLRLESRIARWSPTRGSGWRNHTHEGLDGGLADLGSHLVDQAVTLLGPVTSVSAEVRSVRCHEGPNDDCFLALRHQTGAVSHLHMSAVFAGAAPRFVAQGTRGTYTVQGMDPQQDRLLGGVSHLGAPVQNGKLDGDGARPVETAIGDWARFYVEMVDCVVNGAAPPVDAQDAIDVLRILEAASESARRQTTVTLEQNDSIGAQS